MNRFASLLIASLTIGWMAQAAPVKLSLPGDSTALKAGAGIEAATASCLTCHSAEYISTQPRLTSTAWKASVDKMKAKFGAPIPDDQVAALVDYLTANYGKPDPAK